MGSTNTEPISLKRGAKQGDSLSPLLFNLVMDDLLTASNDKAQGGTISLSTKINVVAYVDDLVALQDNPIALAANLLEITEYVNVIGMSINPSKYAALVYERLEGRVRARNKPLYKINGTWINPSSVVNPQRYLGHDLNASGV